tara:strand:- start:29 stop:217 length:189 start_codon:yes stop_codon:yes gene_type:complete
MLEVEVVEEAVVHLILHLLLKVVELEGLVMEALVVMELLTLAVVLEETEDQTLMVVMEVQEL